MFISFEEWLYRLRTTRQLSQDGLAAALGYSKESVRKYESRGNRPSSGFATSLTEYLSLSSGRAQEFMAFVRGARANEPRHVAEWIGELVEPRQSRRAQTNLPVLLTRLVGRDDDVEQQFSVLARPEVRLLTCTGLAGTGKTRLALALAERMRDVTRDGVYMVELASVRNPLDVERTVADSLRLRDVAERTALETLSDYLRSKHLLLVLDNLEHLALASDASQRGIVQQLISSLLASAPHLKVLATSRVRLQITGERVYTVQPFRLPDSSHEHDSRTFARNPAIELFVDRVRDTTPEFNVDSGNVATVLGICRHVDGIPLAIELAAARCFTLDPERVYALLLESTRLAILVDGPLDHHERQRTLRQAIAWSFALLDAPAQRLFSRVAVFVGGFSAAAADSVSRGVHVAISSDARETSVLLSRLQDLSLLRLTREAAPRFTMLETLREFAQEQLAAGGDWDPAHDAHAMFFVELAERIEPELIGPDQARALATCALEHENVRAALRWLLDHDQLEAAARLGSALWRFWWTRGHLTDGRAWLDRILGNAGALPPRLRARVLTGDGILARTQRSFERAGELLSEALTIWKYLNNAEGAALVLVNLGIVAENLLEFDLARERYAESLDFYRQAEDERGEAHVLNNLSVVAIDEGRFDEAAEFGRRSLEIFERLGIDDRGKSIVRRNLGWIATAQGHFEDARTWLGSSLDITRKLGDREGTANGLNGLALMHYAEATGDDGYRVAYALAGDGLRLLFELADYAGMAESIEILAGCAGKLGAPVDAARGFGVAETLRVSVRNAHFPSQRETYRAMVAEARQGLNQNAWSEAWAEGKARPDEFIAELLGQVGVAATGPRV